MDGAGPAAGTGTPSADQRRRLLRYISALSVLAVVVPVAVLLVDPPLTPAAGWPLALAFGVGLVASELFSVRIRVGLAHQSTTLVELAVVPIVLLFEPSTAITVALVAGVVSELLLRQDDLRKFAFNLSWQVTGVAMASFAYATLARGAEFGAAPRSIAAGLVAAAVFILWNVVTFGGLVAILSGGRVWQIPREEWVEPILTNGGTAVTGLLVALLIQEAPAALPVIVLLGFLIHERQRDHSEAQERIFAERDRFQRTLAGSSDGVVLLDTTGTVQVWNPAMAALTGIDEAQAVGADLETLGWSRLVDADGAGADDDELRLEVSGRVLAVRRAVVPGPAGRTTSTVLTVRDVSREAELARIREDLVMRISHELRTPLTSVEGFLEVLTRHWHDLGDDGRRELVEGAQRGSHRLSRLVANLMVWAGIESRIASPGADEPVDVVDVLRDVLAEVAVDDVHLAVDGDTTVAAGAEDVRTILTNLLSNAALYGAPPVGVTVRRCAGTVELVVSDAGPGLPAAFRPQLFEPFSQASDGLQRTAKGLGMGLAIVRSVAEHHGGAVRHEDAPGGGTRFTVTLPAAEPQPRPAVDVGAASGVSSSSR